VKSLGYNREKQRTSLRPQLTYLGRQIMHFMRKNKQHTQQVEGISKLNCWSYVKGI